MSAVKTELRTEDGLFVYDLDEEAAELCAVAGPDGHDPALLDPDDLPEGFRWVDDDEWERLQPRRCPECDSAETMYQTCGAGTWRCEVCNGPCPCCSDWGAGDDEEELPYACTHCFGTFSEEDATLDDEGCLICPLCDGVME